MNDYCTPILSSVCKALGVAICVIAVCWILFGILLAGGSRSAMPFVGAVGVAPALIFTALVYFGIGQVVDFLGRAAHNTERLCKLLEATRPRSTPEKAVSLQPYEDPFEKWQKEQREKQPESPPNT